MTSTKRIARKSTVSRFKAPCKKYKAAHISHVQQKQWREEALAQTFIGSQTARKPTGGKAPRKQLSTKAACTETTKKKKPYKYPVLLCRKNLKVSMVEYHFQ
jgi:hypothetical protein